MIITLSNLTQCPGGEHISVTPVIDGEPIARKVYEKIALWTGQIDVSVEDVLLFLIRNRVRRYLAANPEASLVQIKNMLEAEVFEL